MDDITLQEPTPVADGTTLLTSHLHDAAFRGVGHAKGEGLAKLLAGLCGMLGSMEACLQLCLELSGNENDKMVLLEMITKTLQTLDMQIAPVLSDLPREELPEKLHEHVIIAQHGQWFRKSADECATWLERLEM